MFFATRMSNIFNIMACMVTRKNILCVYVITKFLETEPPGAARVLYMDSFTHDNFM